MFSDITLKRIAHLYIIIWIIIILILITGFCMFHYFIAGESHVPFIISKLVVISSANTANINLSEGEYTAQVLQNTDIYLSISKNPKYKKEDSIKTVIIRNFKSADNVSNLEITLVSGKVFYTNINLVLPSGDILTNGISSVEYDKLDELIYKRK